MVKLIIGGTILNSTYFRGILFTLNVFDVNWNAVTLRDLGSNWTGEAFSAAPIYLGLMALVGVFMVRFAMNDFFDLVEVGQEIRSLEITEEGNNK